MKKRNVMITLIAICLMASLIYAVPAVRAASDPTGEATGTAADLGIDIQTIDAATLSDAVGHNKISINFLWVLLTTVRTLAR